MPETEPAVQSNEARDASMRDVRAEGRLPGDAVDVGDPCTEASGASGSRPG